MHVCAEEWLSGPSFILNLILLIGPVKLPRQGQLKEMMICKHLHRQFIKQACLWLKKKKSYEECCFFFVFFGQDLTLRRCSELEHSRVSHYSDRVSTLIDGPIIHYWMAGTSLLRLIVILSAGCHQAFTESVTLLCESVAHLSKSAALTNGWHVLTT